MFKFITTKSNYQWINSLLIAISAALLCKETFIVTGISYKGFSIYTVVFFSTLYAYQYYPGKKLFSTTGWSEIKKSSPALRLYYLLQIAGFAILSCLLFHSIQSLFLSAFIVVLALLYYGTAFTDTIFKIRRIYFAKTILLALVWSITTVLLPVSFSGENILSNSVLFVFARRFFFIAALTIPFEIRDRHKDAAVGDKSFVNLVGVKKSKMLAMIFLSIFFFLAVIPYKNEEIDLRLAVAMITSILVSAILIMIYNSDRKGSTLILFCIDGMLMMQFLLIVAAKCFHL